MFPRVNNLLAVAFAILLSCSLVSAQLAPAHTPKVIIDTDFNTIFDDGQAVVMAAQLHAQGTINLLGLTVASGNEWRDQEVVETLKAVERLGIDKSVPVYVGSQYPLLHDFKSFLFEQVVSGPAIDYVGAYAGPQPGPNDLVAPPDGFAQHTKPATQDAVDFMIDTIHRFPHDVTILEIAPPTNLALAIRKDPTIVPLIKQIVTMAGQMFVPATPISTTRNSTGGLILKQRKLSCVPRSPMSSFPWTAPIRSHSPRTFSFRLPSISHKPSSPSCINRLCALLRFWPAAIYSIYL